MMNDLQDVLMDEGLNLNQQVAPFQVRKTSQCPFFLVIK